MTAAKSNGYYIKTSRVRRTSSRRSISLHPGSRWKMHHHCSKFRSQNVQIFGYVYQNRNGLNHGPVWKIQSFLLSEICTVSTFSRTIVGKAIWESPIEAWLGENSKLGMSLCASWKRIILSCVCGWHKIGWKETKSWSDVETTQQRSRFGRTNICLGSCYTWAALKDNAKQAKILWTITEPCLNREFLRGDWKKLPFSQNTCISSWSYDMVGHAKKCVERYCELANKTTSATLQSIYSMHRWPPLQRRRNKICLENWSNTCSQIVL